MLRLIHARTPALPAVLAKRLAPTLNFLGASDLDVAAIRGGDRRVTRAISEYAWGLMNQETGKPVYAGVRYLSRLDTSWECWAVFDRTPTTELERRGITLEMGDLTEIATLFGLKLY